MKSRAVNQAKPISVKIILLPVISLIFLLTGCSNMVEVQDRDFVLALGVSLSDGQYELSYALPDLKALTQENKEEDSEEKSRIPTFKSNSLAEIEELYNHSSHKQLDYRHLEALILDEKISASADKLPAFFKYIEDNYQISRNVRVFYYPGDVKELFEAEGNISGSIGDYLKKLENNNQRKKGLPSVTIGNLMDSLSQKKGLVIPLLELKDQKVEVNGAAIFQEAVYVKALTEEELNIYYIINNQGKDFNFQTDKDHLFKLKEFKTQWEYRYQNNQPVIQLSITGIAELLTQSQDYADIRKDINNYLEKAILDQIDTCIKSDKLDYFNLYDKSSIKSREVWLAYQNRRSDFINDVEIDLSIDIEIQ